MYGRKNSKNSKPPESPLAFLFEDFRQKLDRLLPRPDSSNLHHRNYESSLDKPSAKLKSRGTSKSAASRHLVSQTTKKLEEYLSRRLEEFELAALMLDGLEVAGQTVVVTLGITIDGTKVPLGIWLGSTENSRVCTAMLQCSGSAGR